VSTVLDEARRLADLVVVDCSFSVEDDEELSFDTAAPRRNGATLAVLDAADTVVCVSGADPVGLQRSVRALDQMRTVLPDVEPVLVVNQLRRGPVAGDPQAEIAAAMARFTGREIDFFLPADRDAADAALASGRTLAEVAPRSALRTALRSLASAMAGVAPPARDRRSLWPERRAAG
jgi:Flp pilus assembly CpaE family ATPase